MKQKLAVLKEKILILIKHGKQLALRFLDNCRKFKIKKLKKTLIKLYKKSSKIISDTWKPLVIGIPSFLLCYYVIGSFVSENISTKPLIQSQKEQYEKPRTLEVMQLLLKREVDEHIWTPNLPLIFPAYVLDNMPQFQIGIVNAIKDSTKTLKNFAVSDEQKQSLTRATKLLSYPPNIWLLSQKSSFSIAPSSNSQYRKARKELEKSIDLSIAPENLQKILKNMADNIKKATAKNEAYVREFSSGYIDFHADDLFYRNKGYAFALWQITEALAIDFKPIIISADVYADWTLMVANLQKAAELTPDIVRNAEPSSSFAPNHLLIQNYYLSSARAEALKIANILGEYFNATAD